MNVVYTLDNAGRRTYIKLEGSGMLREFSYEYDALGRTVSETTQEGLVIKFIDNKVVSFNPLIIPKNE